MNYWHSRWCDTSEQLKVLWKLALSPSHFNLTRPRRKFSEVILLAGNQSLILLELSWILGLVSWWLLSQDVATNGDVNGELTSLSKLPVFGSTSIIWRDLLGSEIWMYHQIYLVGITFIPTHGTGSHSRTKRDCKELLHGKWLQVVIWQ